MIFVYKFLTIFFYPLLIFIIYTRTFLGKEDRERYKEKIFIEKKINIKKKNKKLIWFHAASIGEIQSILHLIEFYKKKNIEILITTVTVSAANIVREKLLKNNNIHHRYFPVDTPFIMENFLDFWNPKLIIFVDSEIWPNLMFGIKKRSIKSIIINARITRKSFFRWKLVTQFARQIFSIFNLCLSSNKETVKFLSYFNVKKIKYFGNLKLANKINFSNLLKKNENILNKKKIWCAVSTHKGEDIFFLKTHLLLKRKINKLITIIIPRHINRSQEIKKLCQKLKLQSQILNKNEIIDKSKEIIIINSVGDINNYLKFAKSVFIGKSLLERLKNEGGQNPIEAAKLGCKIYHGPFTYNFNEIYNQLKSLGVSNEVKIENKLSDYLYQDFNKSKKNFNKSIKKINRLGNKILLDNLKEINYFLRK